MSILYADVAYRRCHVSIRQTGFPRTPSRPMSPYGGGFGRFGGRMAVVTLFISYWDHFMRNFNLVCNSVHVFPRIAVKFCMCDFTPSTLEPVFSQFFHEISVSGEFIFCAASSRFSLGVSLFLAHHSFGVHEQQLIFMQNLHARRHMLELYPAVEHYVKE